jgi:hypothetical protein
VLLDTSGTPGSCDGALEIDLNAYAAGALGGNPSPTLSLPGARIHCQWWARDVPGVILLSDALEYLVCP